MKMILINVDVENWKFLLNQELYDWCESKANNIDELLDKIPNLHISDFVNEVLDETKGYGFTRSVRYGIIIDLIDTNKENQYFDSNLFKFWNESISLKDIMTYIKTNNIEIVSENSYNEFDD